MRTFCLSILALAFLTAFLPAQARAQEDRDTNFLITVKARDAKFIGSSVGGAHVMVRNKRTGDIIATGTTYGGTGNTETIMDGQGKRDAVLVDDGTAKLEFSLEFWDPTPVTITAEAPLNSDHKVSVSEDMIIIPGKDYTAGNGIMLELPGFSVDIAKPVPNSKLKVSEGKPIIVEANIMKLCGCHIAEGSPWPPERYDVEAHIYKDGLFITSVEMNYADEPGLYRAKLKTPIAGTYGVIVTAFDPRTKEAGMDTSTINLVE